ncbi:MAG: IS1380 family transposase [Dehalococcoidales bacterium]|nr:IS1380 family transposase [Dehalococcoidales bacterium]
MRQKDKVLGAEIVGGLREASTPWAGASLLVELFRRSGLEAAANKVLPQKGSAKGLKQGQIVESFALLSALGGDCIDDMERLREDEGLEVLLGYRPPAPETARQWLDRFHDEALMIGQPLQGSFIPLESKSLVGLREVNRRAILAYITAVHPEWDVTLDVDVQLVETTKEGAQHCYEGYKAFQSAKVSWAETMLVLDDEFRQGNVSPSKDITRLVDEAYAMLPPGSWRVKVRSDSAAYQQEALDHWRSRGWEFAVSADMSRGLKAEIERLAEDAWHLWKIEKDGVVKEWAEVPYVPTRHYERRDSYPYRYVAVRIRRQQGEFFRDGTSVRHFAVVSNRWDMEGQALLEWQRGKAGTIEQVHHILANELAAGVFPSGKHGANAAWLRLQVITHNLLQLMKKVALPEEYASAHPKRLRFSVFTVMGRVIKHAGQTLLRIADRILKALIAPAQIRIRQLMWDTS